MSIDTFAGATMRSALRRAPLRVAANRGTALRRLFGNLGSNDDRWISRHLQHVWFLDAERSARKLVGFCWIVGAFRFGHATKTNETRSLARDRHNRELRKTTKQALKYPPVKFTGLQARAMAQGFSGYARRTALPVWACAIMPDHVHLVIGKPRMRVEQLVIQLKAQATLQLQREGIHPLARFGKKGVQSPKCWVRGQWKVFLDPGDVPRAIQYVQNNPVKEGMKRQNWLFVSPDE